MSFNEMPSLNLVRAPCLLWQPAAYYGQPHDARVWSAQVFVTAWNEWNEQAVLEPDDTHGHGMLRALRDALRSVPVRVVLRQDQ